MQNYFKGYVAYYNTKMVLEIISNAESIAVPFDKEVFFQIVLSIFYNVLHFNKDTENTKRIKVLFKKNVMVCSSDGFLLEQDLAIRYSEKIFNDTGNLYVLSLGQVLILLKKFGSEFLVITKGKETIIEIKFKIESTHKASIPIRETSQVNNVIKFNKV